jgi:hypothetical protein
MSGARWRQWGRDWAVDLAIATACAVFLGLIGPFGSYFNGPAWQRVAFQIACFWPGMLVYGAMVRGVLWLGWKPAATWAAIVIGTVIITAPFQIFVSRVGVAMWPVLKILRPLDWYLEGLLTAQPVVVGFTLLNQSRMRKRRLASEAGETPPISPSQGLLGGAPSSVLCLQMEDHYVRVHTQGGSRLVLTTMSQAVAAMQGIDGLQVHRSWWVASKAVADAVAEGRNLRLRLANGVVAPVARSSVATVRAAGWIKDASS